MSRTAASPPPAPRSPSHRSSPAPIRRSTGVASTPASLDRAGFDQAGAHRQYGTPQQVGNGTVRTYIVTDQKNGVVRSRWAWR
jgi:hypothetical protein